MAFVSLDDFDIIPQEKEFVNTFLKKNLKNFVFVESAKKVPKIKEFFDFYVANISDLW